MKVRSRVLCDGCCGSGAHRAQPVGVRLGELPGGRFHLHVRVPDNYPIAAPKIRFVTKVCHPNVNVRVRPTSVRSQPWNGVMLTLPTKCRRPFRYQTGEICVDVLASRWSPAWTLQSICLAIQMLLAEPDESSPLNCDASNLLRAKDLRGYRSLVRMYTQLYAMGGGGPNEAP